MIIRTCGSKLALAQAAIVRERLQASRIKTTTNVIKTSSDKITGRPLHVLSGFGAFVREIKHAMLGVISPLPCTRLRMCQQSDQMDLLQLWS
ncbi:MAG: hypothetical protein EF812_00745 [Methanosarcinales archaeon]|nr:MAG: hypothetical protein EF812_00745 [Methanosarcinales archaeon]